MLPIIKHYESFRDPSPGFLVSTKASKSEQLSYVFRLRLKKLVENHLPRCQKIKSWKLMRQNVLLTVGHHLQTTFINFTYFLSYNRANLIDAGAFMISELIFMSPNWIPFISNMNMMCIPFRKSALYPFARFVARGHLGHWGQAVISLSQQKLINLKLQQFDLISVQNKLSFWNTFHSHLKGWA